MSLQNYEVKNWEKLDDGRPVIAINQAIRKATLDCYDRPGETKSRTVTVTIECKPNMDAHGSMDRVTVQMSVVLKTPSMKFDPYEMAIREGGSLLFNDMSEGDIGQKTLDEDKPEAWGDGDDSE